MHEKRGVKKRRKKRLKGHTHPARDKRAAQANRRNEKEKKRDYFRVLFLYVALIFFLHIRNKRVRCCGMERETAPGVSKADVADFTARRKAGASDASALQSGHL